MSIGSQLRNESIDRNIDALSTLETSPDSSFSVLTKRIGLIEKSARAVLDSEIPFITEMLNNIKYAEKMKVVVYHEENGTRLDINLFSNYVEGQVITEIQELDPELLFSFTLSTSVIDIITDHDFDDNSTVKFSNFNCHLDYLANDIVVSLVKRFEKKKVSRGAMLYIVNLLLEQTNLLRKQGRISQVMQIKFFQDTYRQLPDITAQCLFSIFDDIKDTFVLRWMSITIASDFRTRTGTLSKLLSIALKKLNQDEFMEVLGGVSKTHLYEATGISPVDAMRARTEIIPILEKIISDTGKSKDAGKLLALLKEAQESQYCLTPNLITVAFFRVSTKYYNDVFSSIHELAQLPKETIDWVVKNARLGSNFDLDRVVHSVLRNPEYKDSKTDTKGILDKIQFLLEHFDTCDNYIPSNATLARAISTNTIDVVKEIVRLRQRGEYTTKDYIEIIEGVEKETKKEILEYLLPFLSPYFDHQISDLSADQNSLSAFKVLYKEKGSLQNLAKMYFNNKFDNDDELIKGIRGKKQMLFLLAATGTSPYDLMVRNISDKTNELCLEIIGE